MANLIYRGVAHEGIKAKTERTCPDLIYRGTAHDGSVDHAARPLYDMPMFYRGAGYMTPAAAMPLPPAPNPAVKPAHAAAPGRGVAVGQLEPA